MFRSFFLILAMLFAPLSAHAETAPSQSVQQITPGPQFPGSFMMVPEGDGPYPAIVLLGGSEGGDRFARTRAELLVKEGYAVFGFPYYSPAYFGRPAKFPDLPAAFHNIPVDDLEKVQAWLRARPEIGEAPIGLYGVSKGAEYALLGASLIDGFSAVAAIVPSDVVWEGWGPGTTEGESSSFSWRGNPLAFVPYEGMNAEIAKYADPEATVRLRTPQDAGRHKNPARVAAARINIDAIDEPVFVVGGDQDDTWASGEMAQYIAERRAALGLPTESYIFPNAGHALSGDGEQPETSTYRYSDEDIRAQKVVWPAMLAFFSKHLKGAKR